MLPTPWGLGMHDDVSEYASTSKAAPSPLTTPSHMQPIRTARHTPGCLPSTRQLPSQARVLLIPQEEGGLTTVRPTIKNVSSSATTLSAEEYQTICLFRQLTAQQRKRGREKTVAVSATETQEQSPTQADAVKRIRTGIKYFPSELLLFSAVGEYVEPNSKVPPNHTLVAPYKPLLLQFLLQTDLFTVTDVAQSAAVTCEWFATQLLFPMNNTEGRRAAQYLLRAVLCLMIEMKKLTYKTASVFLFLVWKDLCSRKEGQLDFIQVQHASSANMFMSFKHLWDVTEIIVFSTYAVQMSAAEGITSASTGGDTNTLRSSSNWSFFSAHLFVRLLEHLAETLSSTSAAAHNAALAESTPAPADTTEREAEGFFPRSPSALLQPVKRGPTTWIETPAGTQMSRDILHDEWEALLGLCMRLKSHRSFIPLQTLQTATERSEEAHDYELVYLCRRWKSVACTLIQKAYVFAVLPKSCLIVLDFLLC